MGYVKLGYTSKLDYASKIGNDYDYQCQSLIYLGNIYKTQKQCEFAAMREIVLRRMMKYDITHGWLQDKDNINNIGRRIKFILGSDNNCYIKIVPISNSLTGDVVFGSYKSAIDCINEIGIGYVVKYYFGYNKCCGKCDECCKKCGEKCKVQGIYTENMLMK